MSGTISAVGVVVPARDEEDHIGACLDSVLRAVPPGMPAAVCVVLDRCTDRTADRVPPTVDTVCCTRPRPVGALRHLGLRRVLRRLHAHPPDRVWLLSTDADSTVGPDWMRDHLRHAEDGAHAVAGLADLADDLDPRAAAAYSRILREGEHGGGHSHVYGANLGVRADAYLDVGGFPGVPHGEDHALAARLRTGGYRLVTALDARVRTSARTRGRATGGLADLLAGL